MNKTIIWTDGSSRGNPGPGGWGAIVCDDGRVSEIGGKENNTTNNRMEITSAVEALKIVKGNDVILYTDSSYLVSAITKWVFGWQKNNWKKQIGENGKKEDVLNRDLFENLLEVSKGKKIIWKKIPGHSGLPANERCDQMATSFADDKKINLFNGLLADYKINLEFKEGDIKEKKKTSSGTSSKEKAFSYVSKIDGKIFIDKTWDECKKRVSGVSGLKYKKSLSQEDEGRIVGEFENL